jgi:hypothetical protein
VPTFPGHALEAGRRSRRIKEALTFGWKKLTIVVGVPRHANEAKQSSAQFLIGSLLLAAARQLNSP